MLFRSNVSRDLSEVIRIASCPAFREYEGRMLVDIAQEEGVDVTDMVVKILTAPKGDRTLCIHFIIDESDVETNLAWRDMMVGSDGIPDLNGRPHPRLFGTFPRVLGHYVRELSTLPLHTALYKMTGMPADRIGLARRGRMVPDAVADLVVFDPDTITDRATFADPHRYAEGVRHVFVAGEAVLLSERMTGARPGRILRSASYAPASQP